jgi:hypothetical protein
MSDASAASRSETQGSAKTKAPRSPVERIIVWGGILVLLVLVAAQARARMGYQMTVDALRERVMLDEGANPQSLLLKDIDQHIVGWPNRTEEKFGKTEQVVTLTWKGLLSTYGVDVRATQDTEPVVLELIPHGAPEPKLPVADGPMDGEPTDEMARPPMGGAGTMGGPAGHGPGGGPGGGGFNPMDQDTDGDGKISREEAQGRFAENFDRNDTNADGVIDEEELAALMERIRNRSAEGGGPGGGRGRPESETPAESGAPEAADPASGTPSESATETEKPAATDDGTGAAEAPPSSTP